MELIEVNFNDEGDIIDTLSGKILKDTPEETKDSKAKQGF